VLSLPRIVNNMYGSNNSLVAMCKCCYMARGVTGINVEVVYF